MMTLAISRHLFVLPALALAAAGVLAQSPSVYYICPGNVFTNTLSAKEAEAKGCKAREAQQPTTIAGPKPRPVAGNASGPKTDRVESAEQRARDSDARRILEAELRRAEEQLEALKRDFNNGEPERRGDEARNAQRYLDRVAEMKAAILRQEADIAAIKRELAKLPT
ncbi:MAG TPA: hypothetical protein VFY73_25955 [Ideonella sp.]|uniref:hypothetical protein n=1 Tax=Ideonella sp. TaxID=1929293 RepID=UPI002E338FB4|nr:hypothetical protein [Ideonella sp.]HEX5687474.1 hypothetical protein [Ideonella sp.]